MDKAYLDKIYVLVKDKLMSEMSYITAIINTDLEKDAKDGKNAKKFTF